MLERSCGAVVVTEIGGLRHYVLVKGSYVGLPKGHMEPGESERETALREVREETCVSVGLVPGFRRVVTYHMRSGNDKRVVYFLGEFSCQTARRNPEEFLRVLTLPYEEALRALTFENDKMTLRAAERHLRGRAERRRSKTSAGSEKG